MPKRRNITEDEGLDSLLDTMFNVVGILIVVLVAVQLGMQESVRQIAESMVVDPAALEKLIDDIEAARLTKEQLQTDIQQLDPGQQNLDQLIQRLESESNDKAAILKQQQGELKEALIAQEDALKMQKEAEQSQKQRQKLSAELAAAIEQIAKLEATLDQTPPRQQKPARVVNLPNPRPAPDGIKQAIFLCAGNQVYPINIESIRAPLRARAEQLATQRIRKYVEDPQQGIDAEKFLEDFNGLSFRREPFADFFDVEMLARGPDPLIRLTPRKDQGYSIEEIQNPRSRFRKLLAQVSPTQYYFRFFVLSDSYDAYLEARRVTDELGYLSGWDPQAASWKYSINLGGELKFGPKVNKPEPPRPPAAKPNVLD